MQPMTIDANTVVLLSVLLPIAFAIVRVVGELVIQAAATRLPAAKRARIEQIVDQVVAAVESSARGVSGAEKKQIATSMLEDALRAARLTASEQQISTLIDAAVTGLKMAGGAASVAPLAPLATL